jgi:MYXO-CTERM domain-containing protein
MGTRKTPLASLLAASALVLHASRADAYCQTTLCANDTSGVACSPAQANDCGTPLHWAQGCFGYSLAERASESVAYASLASAMQSAATAWTTTDCGNGSQPGIAVFDLGPIPCDQKEYNLQSGNANIVLIHEDAWPYSGAGNTLALTTVTFDLDSAAIFDADLEINGTVDLTTDDKKVQFDLTSIVTHEMGHMLGMAHSAALDATMFIQYQAGDIGLRTLTKDDGAGLCETYPPADVSACDPTPRRGLATICDPPPPEPEGCTCSLASHHRNPVHAAWGTLALVLAAAARRKPRR